MIPLIVRGQIVFVRALLQRYCIGNHPREMAFGRSHVSLNTQPLPQPRARDRRRDVAGGRLRADRALTFRPDACLNGFRADYGCDICAAACPVEAIRPDGFGAALSDACLECGQCAVACRPPTSPSAPASSACCPR